MVRSFSAGTSLQRVFSDLAQDIIPSFAASFGGHERVQQLETNGNLSKSRQICGHLHDNFRKHPSSNFKSHTWWLTSLQKLACCTPTCRFSTIPNGNHTIVIHFPSSHFEISSWSTAWLPHLGRSLQGQSVAKITMGKSHLQHVVLTTLNK